MKTTTNNSNKQTASKRVALLIEQDFEDREVFELLETLRSAGIDVVIVAPAASTDYQGKQSGVVTSMLAANKAKVDDFDAIIVPGGWASDRMRMRHAMVDLVRNASAFGKTVAAICHGPQMLISANVVRDRMITCWPSIAIDVKNAGGLYVDKPVVEDGNLITSRKSTDVPLFSKALIQALSKISTPSK